MSIKKYILGFAVYLIAFAVGSILVCSGSGRLGANEFIGYILCTISIFAVICEIIVMVILKHEEKNNERKNS